LSKRIAYAAIAIVVLITVSLGYFLKDLRFNYVFEDFFPIDDPELEYYMDYREVFGNDNDYLLLSVEAETSIFDTTYLQKVSRLTDSLKSFQHLSEVISPTSIRRPIISPGGFFRIPLLHPKDPTRARKDSLFLAGNDFWRGNMISEDGRSMGIFVRHNPLTSKEMTDSIMSYIYGQLDLQGFKQYRIAGKASAQGVFIEKMQVELLTFLSISIVLVVLFLAYGYRSWWGILIPLIVVLLAVVWTTGLMGATNKPLDILMVLLPTILFVVGMSDVVHIMTKYIEELRLGHSKIAAITTTFREVGLATLLTSITTAVGFATLLTASIRPIREFGVYTAVGVFFAFLVAFCLMPATLILVKRPKVSIKKVHHSAWFTILSYLFRKALRSPGKVIVTSILISALSVVGMFLLNINTYLIEDLPQDDPLKQAFTHFDINYGGSRPFELHVEVMDTTFNLYSPPVVQEIEKVDHYLKTIYEAGSVVSPSTIVKVINQATNGGASEAFSVPEDDWSKVNRYLPRFLRSRQGTLISTADQMEGRITGRVGDIGSKISLQRTAELREFIIANTNTELVRFTVTGTSNLIDKNNEYLANNMFQGLGIAFVVVALIAGFMFRSIRMIFITLLPNIIPLLMVAGIMGYFGIALKLSTSIVFTIAFGIAVDDTIHFISKFKLELNKGKSVLYALKRTYLSTGKAVIITSIILSGGFLTLILSSFGGTFYTGLLVSLTLLFALVIDLSLLPVLIMLFFRQKVK